MIEFGRAQLDADSVDDNPFYINEFTDSCKYDMFPIVSGGLTGDEEIACSLVDEAK